jgi:hypothetical protein
MILTRTRYANCAGKQRAVTKTRTIVVEGLRRLPAQQNPDPTECLAGKQQLDIFCACSIVWS